MTTLRSVPLFPINLVAGGLVNLVLNKTPEGKYEIARVLKPGGPLEGDSHVLGEFDDEDSARNFARNLVESGRR